MIKDENEDPSSPKKEKKKSRIEKKDGKKSCREGRGALSYVVCSVIRGGGECVRGL